MDSQQVKQLLENSLESATVEARGEGCNFEVTIVSPAFEGKRVVQRQQLVYAVLNEQISSEAIHAVTMKTLTPSEAAGNS